MIQPVDLSPEFIIFVLGVLAALSALWNIPEAGRRSLFFVILFYVGTGTQILTHGFQFNQAILNRSRSQKEVEARTAMSLYAYTVGGDEAKRVIPWLTKVSGDPYFIAYRLFKNKDWDSARMKFEQAIREGKFVAPSSYLLAYMDTHDENNHLRRGDWTEAERRLDDAIRYHSEYVPAYYLRAIIKAHTQREKAAVEDLRKSVLPTKFGAATCSDLNDPTEVATFWYPLRGDAKFVELQRECKAVHGEI